jgi:hypothetical protein
MMAVGGGAGVAGAVLAAVLRLAGALVVLAVWPAAAMLKINKIKTERDSINLSW